MIILPQLSVIISTCRPKWLANCLYQLTKQKTDLFYEVIVVIEGDDDYEKIKNHYPNLRYFHKEKQYYAGAFAKDLGIEKAKSNYLCFWDDDNIYYENALNSLYEAAKGRDIGVVKAEIMGLDWRVIPEQAEICYSNIDTMCLCVRRTLAVKAKWSDHHGRGTDYYWVKKLLDHSPTIRFSDAIIGQHLN